MKNITLHWRQTTSNIFQILTPIVCMLFILLLQIIVTEVLGKMGRFENPRRNNDKGHRVYGHPVDLTLAYFMLHEYVFFHSLTFRMNVTIPTDILYTYDDYSENIGEFVEKIFIPVPKAQFLYNVSSKNIDEILFYDLEMLELNKTFPWKYIGALKFSNVTENNLAYTTQYEKPRGAMQGFTRAYTEFCSMLGRVYNMEDFLPCEFILSTSLMNLVSSSFISNYSKSFMEVQTFVTQMDYYKPPESGFSFNVASTLGFFFYPFILLLCLPPILYTIVIEKETELKEIMKLNRLKERNYIIATYFFEFFIYCISATIFFLLGLILQYRFFSQTNGLILFIIYIGVGLTIVSMAFFLSSFISKSFVATIIGYLIVIFVPISGIILNEYVLTPGAYEFKFLLLIPFFPVTDIIYHATQACSQMRCLSWEAFVSNYDFIIALVFLFFDAFFYFLISLYLDKISPKQYGVRKHPLYFLRCFFGRCEKKERKVDCETTEPEDIDVGNERMKIQSGEITHENEGIVINGLTKEFGRGKTKKIAVNRSFFHVKRSECFGLLGPNGAGKTTTVNMISGMFAQTGGKAYVNGKDIKYEMDVIHQSLGLCPQFSVLWDTLTPTEHLLFYIRLKGTAIRKERKHVNSILKEVGLDSDEGQVSFFQKIIRFFFPKEKKAKELSGGMKRRLSIAISLCGSPKVLLLDEPTTGLDPKNRREIWDVIERQKKNRSIILTTHSMEEADALSDRIGIMSHGKLLCLGSSLHLKNRFGNGYLIKIKHEKNGRETVVRFMNEILNDAKLSILKKFANSITFEARPVDENKPFSISKTFENLEVNKKKIGILDFEIQQSTLEDVFLNVIRRDEERIIKNSKSKYKRMSRSEITNELEKNNDIEVINTQTNENDIIIFDEKTSLVSPKNKKIYDSSQFKEDTIIDFESVHVDLSPPSLSMRLKLYLRDCFFQIFFLVWKNFLLSLRRWKVSLLQIITPFIVVLLLFILTLVAQLDLGDWFVHPEINNVNIGELRPCTSWGGVKCYIFLYTTNNNIFAEEVMNEIILDYELKNDTHYKKFAYEQEMLNFIYDNPNTTQTAISFSNITSYPKPETQNITTYTLYFNATSDLKNQINEWKSIIDNMIYFFSMDFIGKPVSKHSIKINEQGYPHPPTRMAVSGQNNIFSTTGPIFFSLISMIVFIISMYQIVLEKEKNLRTGLELIGMKKISYFFSWFVTFICFGVLVSLSTMISGYMFVLDVFVYCNPIFMFLLLFTFTFSLIIFGFALTPLFNKSKSALIGGFIIIGVSFILNMFLANGTIIYLLFNLKEDGYDWICILFEIFYSPFNFGKMFTDIVNKTVKKYDPITNTYVQNDGYWWGEFVNVNKMSAITGDVEAPASFYSILYLFLNSLIYFIVFLYLDVVMPRPNYSGCPPWFFLNFGGLLDKICGKSKKSIENSLKKSDFELEKMENDIKQEFFDSRKVENCSVRVLNAKKDYKTLFRKSVPALKGINLHCVTGTCLGLLGDNGAGTLS